MTASQFLLRAAYNSYWDGLYRVQTVDFNILSSTLPDAMASLIKINDTGKAKEIVESNFNLFSIAVMRCKNLDCTDKDLFVKNHGRRLQNNWLDEINSQDSVKIPIFAKSNEQIVIFEHSYVDSYKTIPYTDNEIGFIYLFRRHIPSYYADMEEFIKKWVRDEPSSSRHTSYIASIVLAFLGGLSIFLMILSSRGMYLSAHRNKLVVKKLLSAIDEKYGKVQ